jgi:hypothetical protein
VTVDGKTVTVPLFSEQADAVAAATVGDEMISVGDLSRALATMHEGRGRTGPPREQGLPRDPGPARERPAAHRRAREMGIADLPR